MKIITIFGQMKEDYDGQYAPDLIAAIDSYGNEDNPDYLIDEMKKAQKLVVSGQYSFVKFMEFEVNEKEFDEVFYGKAVKAKVVKE